ncbi:uncharacterized protein LOC123864918 [Maniola jurtina]|uniref:uncharacterized protein LOC123864918 n=1 Tax=Maniola jurtina TaxID=191418 RepID=UPI001E689EAE|nr:uncharacterized protein LOC123864918 [Maniola jurtina]
MSSELKNESKPSVNPDILCNIKAASIPVIQVVSGAPLKEQLSAPFYFHSLKENEAPPFRKPGKEAKPRLLIGTLITEDDVVEMIAATDVHNANLGFRKKIAEILVRKNIVASYHLPEKHFLIDFLLETIGYAAQRDFNKFKLACLLSIYLSTHLHYKWYYWISPVDVWHYFKQLMIKHTIEDSPDGQEVFEPEECYDIMSHFHTNYLCNLPLVHILSFEVHRLKLLWPFKNKK